MLLKAAGVILAGRLSKTENLPAKDSHKPEWTETSHQTDVLSVYFPRHGATHRPAACDRVSGTSVPRGQDHHDVGIHCALPLGLPGVNSEC